MVLQVLLALIGIEFFVECIFIANRLNRQVVFFDCRSLFVAGGINEHARKVLHVHLLVCI
jgi:hypothetical protein